MTCRHSKGDPDCSSSANYIYRTYEELPQTPDSKKYTIEDAARVGNNMVLKVQYPNCTKCSYEGNKVMVFLNVSEIDVLKWKEIDPHFRDEKVVDNKKAPSPAARFPASKKGWEDAMAYALMKENCSGFDK